MKMGKPPAEAKAGTKLRTTRKLSMPAFRSARLTVITSSAKGKAGRMGARLMAIVAEGPWAVEFIFTPDHVS